MDFNRHRVRRAFSLVEVMVAAAVFAIAILGSAALMTFSFRSIETARAEAQAVRIITHEVESLRCRRWLDRVAANGRIIHGIKALGTGYQTGGTMNGVVLPGGSFLELPSTTNLVNYVSARSVSSFTPFAVYGATPPGSASVATLSDLVDSTNTPIGTTNTRKKIPGDFVCRRVIELSCMPGESVDANQAVCTVTVSWSTGSGQKHTRSETTVIYRNSLNELLNPVPRT